MIASSTGAGLRPYLFVEDGELLVEPLPGISFAPSTSRSDLAEHLSDLAEYGVCDIALQQDGGMTYFTVASNDSTVLLMFDDETDALVAVVPIAIDGDRDWN